MDVSEKPPSSESLNPKKFYSSLGLPDSEDAGTRLLRNFGSYLITDIA
jgi:hypothetical protein